MKLLAKTDPSHGWLQVPINLLEKLNIKDKISEYSYKRGSYAYLEEDCDWAAFGRAMESNGLTYNVECEHSDQDSPIRQYQSFK
jgi:hypothetical protein